MTPEEYREWFNVEELDAYVRERSLRQIDWDDPMDWINGVTIGLAFSYQEHLSDRNMEARFRIFLAVHLSALVRRIELNEE